MRSGRTIRVLSSFGGLLLVGAATGCQTYAPDREVRMTRGYVYYLDGAGGGGALKNYGGGVRKGLLDAGYDGAGEMYTWQTGLGVGADQIASEKYKRDKAAGLAKQILEYRQAHPTPPITVIGLSAGTAIAVFALEALPDQETVENVILLSGSLSANYDLTQALRRVRGKMYVFSSDKDAVLRFLLPMGGTADRAAGTNETIGLQGVKRPQNPSPETQREYQKIVEVGWNEEFKDYGNMGGHTDTVKARFVEAVVAPLVLTSTVDFEPTADEVAGEVANPDYARWARFAPGSWATYEVTQTVGGVEQRFLLKATLVNKDDDRLIVQRTFEPLEPGAADIPVNREFFVLATIDPADHPATDPRATTTDLPSEAIAVGADSLACPGKSIEAPGQYTEWGRTPRGRVYTNPDVPGGLVRLRLSTVAQGQQVELAGQLVRYHVE